MTSPRQPVLTAAMLTRIATVLVWLLIASGPALGLLALATAADGPVGPVAAAPPQRSFLGPGDFAIRYVTAWLASGDAESLRPYFPDAPDLTVRSESTQRVTGLRLAAASESVPGYWSVTVAGVADRTTRYWQVGVVAHGDPAHGGISAGNTQPSYVATSLPAEVSRPATAKAAQLAYSSIAEGASGVVGKTVEGFFGAFLTGAEIDRYLAPGTRLRSPSATGYTRVRVTQVAAVGDVDLTVADNPADGQRLRLLVTVQPTTGIQPAPAMQYAIRLAARAGRWEIAAVDPLPLLASQSGS